MNTDDSRQERELADLARLLPDPARSNFPAGREQVLREHLMSEFRAASEGAAAGKPRIRHRYPKRTVWSAAVGASTLAVAATAFGLTYLTGNAGHPAQPGQAQESHLTAVQLLDKIADAASIQGRPRVHGKYAYSRTEVLSRPAALCPSATPAPSPATSTGREYYRILPGGKVEITGIWGPGVYDLKNSPWCLGPGKTQEMELWTPVSDLCLDGEAKGPAVPGDVGIAGLPRVNGKCAAKPSLETPTSQYLESLPADPHDLLNLLRSFTRNFPEGEQNGEMFTVIGDVLRRGGLVPPQLAAGLYRTAALIPGVTVVPAVTDAAGRPGIAVAYPSGKVLEEWIFSRGTLRFLGERTATPGGNVTSATAIIGQAFVDHLGQVPSSG
jgi:hypothetical protein